MSDKKPLSSNTLFVTNVPFDVSNDAFQEFFQSHGDLSSCFLVSSSTGNRGTGRSKGFGFVTFTDSSVPKGLVDKKETLKLNGRILRYEFASKKEVIERPSENPITPSRSKAPRPTVKQHRLILRNLNFKVTEALLQETFEKYGKLVEIVLPLVDNRPKGYAFLQYKHKSAAVKAIEAMNGQIIMKRPVAIDFTLKKEIYEGHKRGGALTGNILKGSLPSSDDEQRSPLFSSDEEGNLEVEEEGIEILGSDFENSHDQPMNLLEVESLEANSEGLQSDSEEIDSNDTKGRLDKKKLQKPDLNSHRETTFFVKNLLFEASEEDLHVKFNPFGSLRHIKLVRDHQGRSRGSAFVCFLKQEDYDVCLEAYQSALDTVTAHCGGDAASRSIVNKALLAELAPDWVLHGRWIDVLPCIDKKTARKKAQESLQSKRIADKRNLYLLRESYIKPTSSDIQLLDQEFAAKRIRSQEQRKIQMKDPIYFVSTVRLVIHNLSLTMDETELRKLALDASAAYYNSYVLDESSLDPCTIALNKGKDKKTFLKQVKLMRSKDRKAQDGNPRSLGYGFVEFFHFGHALACLRYINMNGKNSNRRNPFAEFAIENSKIVANRQQSNNEDVDAKEEVFLPIVPKGKFMRRQDRRKFSKGKSSQEFKRIKKQ